MAALLRYPGKVVIVTGGTSGIGLATVREFEIQRQTVDMAAQLRYPGKVVTVTGGTSGKVRQGANVVFCSKSSDAEVGQSIQRELKNSGCPGDAYYKVCDVRKETDIKRLISATLERYGCLDCLVNNAGDGQAEKLDDVSSQSFRNTMELNTLSVLLASKHALPYLRETRGNIINMACLTGMIGAMDAVSYSASKGAVLAMTKTLAIDESKYGVRVNCISPGCIWTALWERHLKQSKNPEATLQEFKSSQLLGRFGTPEEVALAALYLAADGTFCTGSNLVVSGGAEVGFGKKLQGEF